MEKISAEPTLNRFTTPDDVVLTYREMGSGRPLILIHGYFSTAAVNWIRYGHAAKLAAAGYRVIMPDLRGHGDSDRPHDPVAYPPDVLADDGLALVAHLGITEYDLGGYSLGARTTIRMLVRGATPARAIVAGMGLQGLTDTAARRGFFRSVLAPPGPLLRGSPEWLADAFLKTVKGDAVALLLVLDSFVDTSLDELENIEVPILVVAGEDDRDNGSAAELAATLKKSRHVEVPGNHMTTVMAPELGLALVDFLGGTETYRRF